MTAIAQNDKRVKALLHLYKSDLAAQNVLDWLAARSSNDRETDVDTLEKRLPNLTRPELLGVMRQLDEIGVARFFAGRRQFKTRLRWTVQPIQVGKVAQGAVNKLEGWPEEPAPVVPFPGGHGEGPHKTRDTANPSAAPGGMAITINPLTMPADARKKLAAFLLSLPDDDNNAVTQ